MTGRFCAEIGLFVAMMGSGSAQEHLQDLWSATSKPERPKATTIGKPTIADLGGPEPLRILGGNRQSGVMPAFWWESHLEGRSIIFRMVNNSESILGGPETFDSI